MNSSGSNANLSKKLGFYSLIAGAGALSSAGLSAAPVDANVNGQITITPGATEPVLFDFDLSGDGEDDFRLEGFPTSSPDGSCAYVVLQGIFRDGSVWGQVVTDPVFQFGAYAALIAEGAEVGESLNFSQFSGVTGTCYTGGFFPPPTRGFIGLRVPVPSNVLTGAEDSDRGNGSDFLYAYADIEVTEATDGSLSVTIFNAFRESSPNEPITTPMREPDQPAVPVPLGGALPLGLLLLAAGGLALRRRQQRLAKD